MDMNNDFRTQQKPKMTADYLNGMYREQTVREYEFNIDFLLKYQRAFLNDRLTLSAAVGGNEMRYSYATTKITAPELEIDGVYKLKNSAVTLVTDASRREKGVHSIYEFVNLGWDDTYFLDITCRNRPGPRHFTRLNGATPIRRSAPASCSTRRSRSIRRT